MSRVVVFGAGGRAGRAAVQEARQRGHQVTAVVRDQGKHADLAADGVLVAAGDVTDADRIAQLAASHDAAISAAADLGVPADVFFGGAAGALLDGLARAGVNRLLVVGLASVLETSSGELLMDTPGYPQDYRSFYLGHAVGSEVLRNASTALDWLVMSPAGDFDHGDGRIGRYRTAQAEATSRITYADFAIALLDEIDMETSPYAHRHRAGLISGTNLSEASASAGSASPA